jgi:ligand-binding SRPBCC domain-containing protein
MATSYFLHRETTVPAPLERTFQFFSAAENLERLTPPWLNFTVLSPLPVQMRVGAEIAYRLRLYGIPLRWKSRIDLWEPGVAFIDRQVAGPYRWWRHEHRFEAVRGGTRVIDRVEYMPPLHWVSGRWVARDVERIFTYRQDALREIFAHG